MNLIIFLICANIYLCLLSLRLFVSLLVWWWCWESVHYMYRVFRKNFLHLLRFNVFEILPKINYQFQSIDFWLILLSKIKQNWSTASKGIFCRTPCSNIITAATHQKLAGEVDWFCKVLSRDDMCAGVDWQVTATITFNCNTFNIEKF